MKKLLSICFLLIVTYSHASVRITSLHQISNVNSEYLISEVIDMRGEFVSLPNNTTLRFSESGMLINGTLEGNNAQIKAGRIELFTDINLKGTWNNTKVYSEWVGLQEDGSSNDQQFSNLMTLCNGHKLTHLYVQEGDFYVSAHNGSAPIILPSNVYWHNKARIHMLPTDLTKYSIILALKVSNITIDGGEFIGDVKEHYGTEGEWGHGIKCAGATNVTLKNLKCTYCWGDGIDLIEGWDDARKPTINCENITIKNVQCLYNRRQGMSIEAAHHVIVSDCEFAYTGTPFTTNPAAGVDIEEWNTEGHKMKHLLFRNCSFHDNKGYDLQCEPNWKMGKETYRVYENNIRFEKCLMDRCRVIYTNGILFHNCEIQDITVHNSNDVNLSRCTIEKYAQSKNDKKPKIKKCKGKAIQLSYVVPASVVGITSILGLGYLTYIKNDNEKGNNIRNV